MTQNNTVTFDVDASGLLKHRLSVPAKAYPRLNDVAGAGPDSFYATVESVHKRGSWMERATLMTRPGSAAHVSCATHPAH